MVFVAGSSTHGEVSSCQASRRIGILCTTVRVALRCTLMCCACKIYELLPGDFVKWRAVALWALQKLAKNDDWMSYVLWTNEAHFELRGSFNSHNCIIWEIENLSKLHSTIRILRCDVDLPLSGPFTSKKSVILVFNLLVWQVRGTPICYIITSFLAINTSWKAQLLCRMAFHCIMLNMWKSSCAGLLVMIVCWAATFVCLAYQVCRYESVWLLSL